MSNSFPTEAYHGLLMEIYRVMRANGIVEFLESANEYNDAGPIQTTFWYPKVAKLREILGMDSSIWKDFGPWLETAGFHTVQALDFLQPVGKWAGRHGETASITYSQVLRGQKLRLMQFGIVESEQEVEEALQLRLKEVDERQEAIVWIVYTARK
jgi:hypothetical protein